MVEYLLNLILKYSLLILLILAENKISFKNNKKYKDLNKYVLLC